MRIVPLLMHLKQYARRIQLILIETFFGMKHINLLALGWSINLHRLVKTDVCAQVCGNAQSEDSVVKHIGLKFEATVAVQRFVERRETLKTLVNAFDCDHLLTVAISQQCLIFEAWSAHHDFRNLLNLVDGKFRFLEVFSFYSSNLQLRVERRKERCDHVVKAVKHRKRAYQGDGGNGNSANRDA